MTSPHPTRRAVLIRRVLKITLVLVLVLTPVILLYRWLKPADKVLVTVKGIDPSTRLLCMVVDTPRGPEAMWWSLEKVTPFRMHPNHCTVSDFNSQREGNEATRPVSWVDGARYGVLTGDNKDRWRVFWYNPEEVHLRGRYWLIGGGESSLILPPKDAGETASEAFLDQIGFGPSVREDWRHWLRE